MTSGSQIFSQPIVQGLLIKGHGKTLSNDYFFIAEDKFLFHLCTGRGIFVMFDSQYLYYTLHRLYFGILEGRFMFSFTFRKLSLDFNLEYLSHFFIKSKNQGQFQNPHHEQIPRPFLNLEFVLEMTKIFKIKDIT